MSLRDPEVLNIRYRNMSRVSVAFHSHPLHEIYFFHQGNCTYLIGDKIYRLQPGDLILMHGMTLHSAHVDGARDYIRTVIHFDPSYVQRGLQFPHHLDLLRPFRELKNIRLSLTEKQQSEMDKLLHQMSLYDVNRDPLSNQRLHLTFFDLLTTIYQLCEDRMHLIERDAGGYKTDVVNAVISYIEDHFHEDFHLDQLELALHMNKHYLAKLFKEVTGSTIFTYLYHRRINESRILFITDPKAKVTEVAYRVGFKHPAHFSRIFKTYVGYTPEQFRRNWKTEGNLMVE